MLDLILRSLRLLFLKASAIYQTDELFYQLYTMYSAIFSKTQKALPILQYHCGTPARRRAQSLCPGAYYEVRLYKENCKYHDMTTAEIIKSKSLTTSTLTWLNSQDKKKLPAWTEAENVQTHNFYLSSPPLFWIQVLFRRLRTQFLKYSRILQLVQKVRRDSAWQVSVVFHIFSALKVTALI